MPQPQRPDRPVPVLARPRPVDVASLLLVISVAVTLVGLVVTIITIPTAVDQTLRTENHTFDRGTLVALSVALALLIGVGGAALTLVFVVFARRGSGWARSLLTVLTIVSLAALLDGPDLGALAEVLRIPAIVLLFIPPSAAWFLSRRAEQRALKAQRMP